VLVSKPLAYWRLNEFEGPEALDSSGHDHHAVYEPGVVFYLEGPVGSDPSGDAKRINRAPQCAGGRISARITTLPQDYTIEMWFKNYLPADARDVTGHLFSRGPDPATGAPGDHLGIGGNAIAPGMLFFARGDGPGEYVRGAAKIGLKTWNHLAMVRDHRKVLVYLNGAPVPDIDGKLEDTNASRAAGIFIGGRCDGVADFEGRIDEVALYDRPLRLDEITRHYRAAGPGAPDGAQTAPH
jgi:hypothetical protein